MRQFLSPNHGERVGGQRPCLIVLHYTALPDAAASKARLCDPVHEVSSHWLVDLDGSAEALVDESRRAWHAGAGSWGGITDMNSASIGIELQNIGHAPFPEPQMAGLERLLAVIFARWSLGPPSVIGHSDLAPTRKADPGPHFDWRRLALGGLSVWPEAGAGQPAADLAESCQTSAHAFGYPKADLATVLHAFRLRFRPWAKGPLDATDAAMAADLAARYPAA
jgi:N-acetylmuramoyl-L-alanine amidase